LAGANLNEGDPDVLLHALSRSFHFLPANQRQVFLQTDKTKGLELAKLARRRDGQDLDCAM
jgi:hypothetical protein